MFHNLATPFSFGLVSTQPDIFHRSGAKGCSDHRFRAPLTSLHCPIANSASTQSQQPVNRTQLIKSSELQERASSTQTMPEQSPILSLIHI